MDDEEENTEEEGEVRGGDLKCYIQTDIQTYRHTDPPTKRVLEEHSLLKRFLRRRNVIGWGIGAKPSLCKRNFLKLKTTIFILFRGIRGIF